MFNSLFEIFKSIRDFGADAKKTIVRLEEREKLAKNENKLLDQLKKEISCGLILNKKEAIIVFDRGMHMSSKDRDKLHNTDCQISSLELHLLTKYETVWKTIIPYNPSYYLPLELKEIIGKDNTNDEFKHDLKIFSQKIEKILCEINLLRAEYQKVEKEFSKLTPNLKEIFFELNIPHEKHYLYSRIGGSSEDVNYFDNVKTKDITSLKLYAKLAKVLDELDISPNNIRAKEGIASITKLISEHQKNKLSNKNANITNSQWHNLDCKSIQDNEFDSQHIGSPPHWIDEVPPCEDETLNWVVNSDSVSIKESFEAYGVISLWHMTHVGNIRSILSKGILSNNQAFTNTKPVDISDHSVQRWRDKTDPKYGRELHDYVPTYFNIKNPMLYAKSDIKNNICLIEISLSVLSSNSFIFTDGNAASKNTKFFHLTRDLQQLPWDTLNATYWSDFEDGKRERCAEVLVYPMIPAKYIKKVYCSSQESLTQLSDLPVQSSISEKYFF